jgi:hypothetical protein
MAGLCGGWPENIGSEEMRKSVVDHEEWAIILKEAMIKI